MKEDTKLILRLLLEVGNPVQGRTMMQKILFILRSKYHKFEDYSFSLHYYGPFSEDLAEQLGWLKHMGFIKENPVWAGDVVRFDISLTDDGERIAQKTREGWSERSFQKMFAEARELNRSRLSDVIDRAYRIAERQGLD